MVGLFLATWFASFVAFCSQAFCFRWLRSSQRRDWIPMWVAITVGLFVTSLLEGVPAMIVANALRMPRSGGVQIEDQVNGGILMWIGAVIVLILTALIRKAPDTGVSPASLAYALLFAGVVLDVVGCISIWVAMGTSFSNIYKNGTSDYYTYTTASILYVSTVTTRGMIVCLLSNAIWVWTTTWSKRGLTLFLPARSL